MDSKSQVTVCDWRSSGGIFLESSLLAYLVYAYYPLLPEHTNLFSAKESKYWRILALNSAIFFTFQVGERDHGAVPEFKFEAINRFYLYTQHFTLLSTTIFWAKLSHFLLKWSFHTFGQRSPYPSNKQFSTCRYSDSDTGELLFELDITGYLPERVDLKYFDEEIRDAARLADEVSWQDYSVRVQVEERVNTMGGEEVTLRGRKEWRLLSRGRVRYLG